MPRGKFRDKSNAHTLSTTTRKKSQRHRRWEPGSWATWKLEEYPEWSDSELVAFDQWVGPNRDDIEEKIEKAIPVMGSLPGLLSRFHADGNRSRSYSATPEQLYALGVVVASASIAFLCLEEKEKYAWVLAIIVGLSSMSLSKQMTSFFYGSRQFTVQIKIDHAVEEVNRIPVPGFHTLPKLIFNSSIANTPEALAQNVALIGSKLHFLEFILTELREIDKWAESLDDRALRREGFFQILFSKNMAKLFAPGRILGASIGSQVEEKKETEEKKSLNSFFSEIKKELEQCKESITAENIEEMLRRDGDTMLRIVGKSKELSQVEKKQLFTLRKKNLTLIIEHCFENYFKIESHLLHQYIDESYTRLINLLKIMGRPVEEVEEAQEEFEGIKEFLKKKLPGARQDQGSAAQSPELAEESKVPTSAGTNAPALNGLEAISSNLATAFENHHNQRKPNVEMSSHENSELSFWGENRRRRKRHDLSQWRHAAAEGLPVANQVVRDVAVTAELPVPSVPKPVSSLADVDSLADALALESKKGMLVDNSVPIGELTLIFSAEMIALLKEIGQGIEQLFDNATHLEIYASMVLYFAQKRILSEEEFLTQSRMPENTNLMIPLQNVESSAEQVGLLINSLEARGFSCTKDVPGKYKVFTRRTASANTPYENNVSLVLQFPPRENANGIPLTQHRLQLNYKTNGLYFNPGNEKLNGQLLDTLKSRAVALELSELTGLLLDSKCHFFARLLKVYFQYRDKLDIEKVQHTMTDEAFLFSFFRSRASAEQRDVCYFEMAALIAKGYFHLPESSPIIAAFIKALINRPELSDEILHRIVSDLQEKYPPNKFFEDTNSKDIIYHFYNTLFNCISAAKIPNLTNFDINIMMRPLAISVYEKQRSLEQSRLSEAPHATLFTSNNTNAAVVAQRVRENGVLLTAHQQMN